MTDAWFENDLPYGLKTIALSMSRRSRYLNIHETGELINHKDVHQSEELSMVFETILEALFEGHEALHMDDIAKALFYCANRVESSRSLIPPNGFW